MKLPALQPGESTDAIIDLRDGNRSAVFVLDLCRVRVLHFSGDTLAESVSAPSGATLAGFRLTRQGPVLLLEVGGVCLGVCGGGGGEGVADGK